jgi:hypothetical protein
MLWRKMAFEVRSIMAAGDKMDRKEVFGPSVFVTVVGIRSSTFFRVVSVSTNLIGVMESKESRRR